jgi:PcfJ-like protein
MSWSERYVQDHRKRTDRAIHRACNHLASDPLIFAKFQELLICARTRAPRLFEAPVNDGRHLGVDALFHLARFQSAHIRPTAEWTGTSSSWRPAVASLTHHLTCRYEIPAFMASVWHAVDAAGDRKRSWVIAHSRGASFRSLDLPVIMTRKMENIFLASHDHLALEPALRRAELLALGMPIAFMNAILSTRLAMDLRNSDFWRTVWMFFIAYAGELNPTQIGPMIDYIQSIRHDRIQIETQAGIMETAPPQPSFSINGRTVPSMLRLMKEWHRDLGVSESTAAFTWARSPFKPWLLEEPRRSEQETPKRWHMVELIDSAQLREEGTSLHHCVGSYAYRCYRGTSSIWSLRTWQGEKKRSMLTIEVDPKKRAVIQARGKANRSASGKPLKLLHEWASREGLDMAIS